MIGSAEINKLKRQKQCQLARILQLERQVSNQQKQLKDESRPANEENKEQTTTVLPPHLFMKAFELMRGSGKALLLKVVSNEIKEIER